ncbi:MAG: hypothetical protein D6725_01465 [Planctomycetota bacterium]|nr:MAG: hypothetical protein D6725_01465 [Planctomycetota bacterium]
MTGLCYRAVDSRKSAEARSRTARSKSCGSCHGAAVSALLALIASAGCAGPLRLSPFATASPQMAESAELRRRFVVERSPEAIRTLLREHVERGMTLEEVQAVLGEPGERVYDDAAIKRGSPLIHQADVIYRWGPDRNGRSYYLAFREGKLVHFPAD